MEVIFIAMEQTGRLEQEQAMFAGQQQAFAMLKINAMEQETAILIHSNPRPTPAELQQETVIWKKNAQAQPQHALLMQNQQQYAEIWQETAT